MCLYRRNRDEVENGLSKEVYIDESNMISLTQASDSVGLKPSPAYVSLFHWKGFCCSALIPVCVNEAVSLSLRGLHPDMSQELHVVRLESLN